MSQKTMHNINQNYEPKYAYHNLKTEYHIVAPKIGVISNNKNA